MNSNLQRPVNVPVLPNMATACENQQDEQSKPAESTQLESRCHTCPGVLTAAGSHLEAIDSGSVCRILDSALEHGLFLTHVPESNTLLDCLSEIKVYCLTEPADRPLHVPRTLVYLSMIHL